jgi:hypothetical protein
MISVGKVWGDVRGTSNADNGVVNSGEEDKEWVMVPVGWPFGAGGSSSSGGEKRRLCCLAVAVSAREVSRIAMLATEKLEKLRRCSVM